MFHTTLVFLSPRLSTVPAVLARCTETQPLLRPAPAPHAGPALALTTPAAVQLGRWVGHIVYHRDERGILTVVCGKLEPDEQDRRGLFDKLFGLLQGIGWSGTVRLTVQQKETCLRMERMFAASRPACAAATGTSVTTAKAKTRLAPPDCLQARHLPDAHRKPLSRHMAAFRPLVRDYKDATRLAARLAADAGAYGTTLEALVMGDGRQRVVQSIYNDLDYLLSVDEEGRRQASTVLHHTALSLAGFAHGIPAPYGEHEIARLHRFPPQSCRPAMALLWQTPNFEDMVLALCKREASLRPDPALEALCMSHPKRERAAMLLAALHDSTRLERPCFAAAQAPAGASYRKS
ncbi:hypothetical protein [Paracidovorax citrulli]